MEEGLLPLTQKSMRFYNRIAYHDYEGVADDLDDFRMWPTSASTTP